MADYSEHKIKANGIQIHYYRSIPEGDVPGQAGSKIPIILNHGITDNGMCWVRVADALSESYDVIMPDTRGHGLSGRPRSGYGVEERAADIAGLANALKLDHPVLFGHSLGGAVCTAAAALYPHLFRAAVLEDPAWFSSEGLGNMSQAAKKWRADLRRQKKLGREGLIALIHKDNPGWHADELGPWAEAKLQMSEQALVKILEEEQGGWQNFLCRIECPVLVLTGDEERGIIVNPAMAEEAVSLNPRVRVAHIAGAGHSIHRDRFEPAVQAVLDFLAEAE